MKEMKEGAARSTTDKPTLGVGSVALTFLDTTWRIAIPVVLFTLLGIYVDLQLGTKPWLTLLAVVIGFGVAIHLIKDQLAAVLQAERKVKK